MELKSHSAVLLPGGGTIMAGQTPGATPSASPSASDTPSATPDTPSETPSTGQQTPGAEQPGPAITVTGAKPGQMLNVTISFGTAAPITTYVPVLTDDHYSASPTAAE